MDGSAYFYEPGKGHGLPHDRMASIVAPRPIGWISTHDGAGRRNPAPYSFFNIFNYKPQRFVGTRVPVRRRLR